MKKKPIIIAIIIVLSLCILFIFSNSLKNGAQTTVQSGTVKAVIEDLLHALKIDADIDEQTVRALGHFAEFFALSCILTVSALLVFPFNFQKPFTKRILIYISPIAISAAIAFIDEFIQLFSPGRACDIMDVLVDVSGAAAANLLIIGIILIIYAFKKRKDYA